MSNIPLSFLISEIKVWSSAVTLPIFSFLFKNSNTHLKNLTLLKSITKNKVTIDMVTRENINTGTDTLPNVPLNTTPTNEKTQREKRSILFSNTILPIPLFRFKWSFIKYALVKSPSLEGVMALKVSPVNVNFIASFLLILQLLLIIILHLSALVNTMGRKRSIDMRKYARLICRK